MRKFSILSLLLVMASCFCHGQNNHIKALVSERVFLAPTETYYDKNDTVEVVGQLLSTDYGDFFPYSRYLYLELADKKNELVMRQKVRCDQKGRFYATLPLDGNVENGVYYLRGYTQFMRNRFEVKTRTVMKREEISSNGITIRPMGISYPQKEYKCKLPNAEGKYKVLIDIISPDRQVLSYVKSIEVKK